MWQQRFFLKVTTQPGKCSILDYLYSQTTTNGHLSNNGDFLVPVDGSYIHSY